MRFLRKTQEQRRVFKDVEAWRMAFFYWIPWQIVLRRTAPIPREITWSITWFPSGNRGRLSDIFQLSSRIVPTQPQLTRCAPSFFFCFFVFPASQPSRSMSSSRVKSCFVSRLETQSRTQKSHESHRSSQTTRRYELVLLYVDIYTHIERGGERECAQTHTNTHTHRDTCSSGSWQTIHASHAHTHARARQDQPQGFVG